MLYYLRFILLFGFMFAIGPAFSSPSVVGSKESAPVVGRLPLVTRGFIEPQIPKFGLVGTTYEAKAITLDHDGDYVYVTKKWYLDGVLVSHSNFYTPPYEAKRKTLKLVLSPYTDANVTEPSTGPDWTVGSWELLYLDPRFIFDKGGSVYKNYNDADQYCKSMGARLPTRREFEELFNYATSIGPSNLSYNNDLCTVHNIPLAGMCGGSSSFYWATRAGLLPVKFDLESFVAYEAGPAMQLHRAEVACIR